METTDPTQAFVRETSLPLYQAQGWMKFLGVMMILQGALTALTIIGIIVAWLPIWLGILLFKAAGHAEAAQYSGDKARLIEALAQLKLYFIINGIVLLIMVGFMVFGIFIGGLGFLSALGEMG